MDSDKRQRIASDTNRGLLDHCLDNLDIESIDYCDVDTTNEGKIEIVIRGKFTDDNPIKQRDSNPVDAYDRAMKGL